jgi:hypothetical protein
MKFPYLQGQNQGNHALFPMAQPTEFRPSRPAVSRGFRPSSILFCLAVGSVLSCRKAAERKVERSSGPQALCAGKVSEDPPRRELDPGIRAFEAKRYRDAQAAFNGLSVAYPSSGSVRVWLGDAIFYDKEKSEDQAAREAIVAYEAADRLHAAGCALPRRPRYYGLIGIAYAELRLAKAGGPQAGAALGHANAVLATLEVEFPTSAEVPYTEARAACLGAQIDPEAAPSQVQRCLERFKKTISIANGYERPRFLRVHRSTPDWLVRAETQSELGPLRSSPDYQQFVRETVRAVENGAASPSFSPSPP